MDIIINQIASKSRATPANVFAVRLCVQFLDRRIGELNGSLSGSARFISLLTIMDNARFS
jgi:hypothetical protein